MSQTVRISRKTVDFRCGRRTFLRSCALCGAGLAAGSLMPFCSAKETTSGRKLRLRVIYSLHENAYSAAKNAIYDAGHSAIDDELKDLDDVVTAAVSTA